MIDIVHRTVQRGHRRLCVALMVRGGNQLQFQPARPVSRTKAAEDGHEGVSKLLRHGAVENEVHRIIDQGHGVKQVAQGVVNSGAEALDENVHKREDALWELGDCEKDDNCEQHSRGPIVLPVSVGFSFPALRLEAHALTISFVHRQDEKDRECG